MPLLAVVLTFLLAALGLGSLVCAQQAQPAQPQSAQAKQSVAPARPRGDSSGQSVEPIVHLHISSSQRLSSLLKQQLRSPVRAEYANGGMTRASSFFHLECQIPVKTSWQWHADAARGRQASLQIQDTGNRSRWARVPWGKCPTPKSVICLMASVSRCLKMVTDGVWQTLHGVPRQIKPPVGKERLAPGTL